jgi:hypothetical protein
LVVPNVARFYELRGVDSSRAIHSRKNPDFQKNTEKSETNQKNQQTEHFRNEPVDHGPVGLISHQVVHERAINLLPPKGKAEELSMSCGKRLHTFRPGVSVCAAEGGIDRFETRATTIKTDTYLDIADELSV